MYFVMEVQHNPNEFCVHVHSGSQDPDYHGVSVVVDATDHSRVTLVTADSRAQDEALRDRDLITRVALQEIRGDAPWEADLDGSSHEGGHQ